jgi:DNA-binding response OmpR family regulator
MTQQTILLVEDEPQIRELYSRILTEAGYLISECEDGEDAYTQILGGTFDLVLLDIMLPKLSGTDILRKLKENSTTENLKTKIVMLTNLDQDVVKGEAMFYGVAGYLVKDQIDIVHLADEVKKYLL